MHRLPLAFRLRQHRLVTPRNARPSYHRFVSRIAYKEDGEAIRYQSVRFKNPIFSRRRAFSVAAYTLVGYCSWQLITTYFIVEVDKQDETTGQVRGEGNGEGEEIDFESSLFIPMTWATQMSRTYYRGSDPEWQEFVRIARDKPRHQKIQEELAQIVFQGSQGNPLLSVRLGKELRIGKYWLDISFPDGPPREYERSGILIGDNFIAWARQEISQDDQWRVLRALWPKAAFDAIWATGKVLVGINYRRAKQVLGLEEKDPVSPEERYRHALEMTQKQQQSRERKEVGKAQLDPDGNSGVIDAPPASEAQSSRLASSDPKKMPWQMQVAVPSTSSTGLTDGPIAMHVLRHSLTKSWAPPMMEPPKGTFVVQGLVEVVGNKGRLLVDVQSCYDPKQAKFVVVVAKMRSFKNLQQVPRGGP